ncbi:class I SAM-dependent methyltransferase [Candidatus Pollutiaquabacter sp.]|uniref:class I SAM-dependent methyltransferase n=1 Tax=Candidatus Pollutiaquabacter sp. TaxID=3416354 RepID=UPI003D0D5DF6
MQYDPIKRSLGNVFNKTPFLRKIFYRMLDLLLLRAWHVHKELRSLTPELLRRERDGGVQVLDAGAGFGQYSYWINRKHPAWNILALDVKDEQVADCNRFFSAIGAKNVRFEVGDLTTYVKAGTYDLIVCVDVMEHIEPDVQVFRNYHASMKNGGVLLISTPSDQGWQRRTRRRRSLVHRRTRTRRIQHRRDRRKTAQRGLFQDRSTVPVRQSGQDLLATVDEVPDPVAGCEQTLLHHHPVLLPHRLPHRLCAELGRCIR